MGILWLYWENPRGEAGPPPFITLCRKSIELHAGGHDIRVVTPQNLATYLPNYPHRLFKIAAEPLGRIDKYFNRGGRRTRAIAQRADYVRALLLEKYGGIYLDADAILLADLTPYFDLLATHDFSIVRRTSSRQKHISNGFYGSHPGGIVISEYVRELRERLAGRLEYQGNEVGRDMLTPIVNRHQDVVFEIPEQDVHPVPFDDAEHAFINRSLELEDVLAPSTRIFMLWGHLLRDQLRGISLDELYRSDMLISKAYRAAIPEDAFLELKQSVPSYRRAAMSSRAASHAV